MATTDWKTIQLTADPILVVGLRECADDRVLELLDALEGRFFDDAFTTEKRRADRFRKRV